MFPMIRPGVEHRYPVPLHPSQCLIRALSSLSPRSEQADEIDYLVKRDLAAPEYSDNALQEQVHCTVERPQAHRSLDVPVIPRVQAFAWWM